MTKKASTPALRFKGFTYTWKQRKWSDRFSDFIVPMRDKPKKFGGNIPWTRIEDIEGKYLNGSLSGQFVSKDTIKQMNLKIIPKDSLIVSSSATFGVVAIITQDLITNQTFIGLVPNDKETLDFWYTFFHSNEARNYMRLQSAGSTIFYIAREHFEKMPIIIPFKDEMITIGKYFSNLDRLITLHQRKYDKLTNMKKSMLEKMFPNNGANVPEIRFKGFTDAWEQRKLKEVVNVYDGVHQTPDYKDSGVMFLSVENISILKSEKYISEEAFQKDYKVYPQKGDVLMTRIGDVGTPNVVETTEKVAFYVSLALLKPTKINSYFLCNSIQSPLFQKGLKDRTLVTAIPQKINKDEIGKVNIILPASSQEQQLIGEYFRNLDRLITLHQRELEKLKNLKKACLEKMFV